MQSKEYCIYTYVFPLGDSDFNTYIRNTEVYLQENWQRLVKFRKPHVFASHIITGDLADALFPVAEDPRKLHLLELCSRWTHIYPHSKDVTPSQTTISAKDQLRAKLENILASIFMDIPQSFLTETDRKELCFELCNVHSKRPLPMKIFWS